VTEVVAGCVRLPRRQVHLRDDAPAEVVHARVASTPESITAIAGVAGAGVASVPQSASTPAADGHAFGSAEVKLPLGITRPSSDTASTPGEPARVCSAVSGMSAATPPMIERLCRTVPPTATTAALAVSAPPSLHDHVQELTRVRRDRSCRQGRYRHRRKCGGRIGCARCPERNDRVQRNREPSRLQARALKIGLPHKP